MNSTLTAAIISGCLLGAILLGMRIRRLLPAHHRDADTKDTVKLAMGLVATMSALLLGLLVASAKGVLRHRAERNHSDGRQGLVS